MASRKPCRSTPTFNSPRRAFSGHFESKKQLFEQVLAFQQRVTNGWTHVPPEYEPCNTTLEEILAFVSTRLVQMLDGVDRWILVLVDFCQETKDDPDMQRLLVAKDEEGLGGIGELVQCLKDRGWVARDRDTREIARQVLALNEGFHVFSALARDPGVPARVQELVKLLS